MLEKDETKNYYYCDEDEELEEDEEEQKLGINKNCLGRGLGHQL